jgi:hypothetical protein
MPVAGSTPVTAELPPAPAERSAERERLAQAASKHAALVDRRRRLVLAAEQARGDSMAALRAVDNAEAGLAVAQREAPRLLALAAIGEAAGSSNLEAAQREAAGARAEHAQARDVVEALRAELITTDQRLTAALSDRQAAVRGVLEADPAMDLLYAEYLATLTWTAALADVFKLIGPSRLPSRMQYWDRTNHELPPVDEPSPVTQWREALAALERGEVDRELPAIG